MTLFRIAGINVQLDFSWLLIFLLLLTSLSAGYLPHEHPGEDRLTYWTAGFITTILFFGSILAHELSHAMMAIRSGIQVPAITLFLFGGIAHTADEAENPSTELSIAIVGPLMSFALAGLFWMVGQALPEGYQNMAGVVCNYLTWINLMVGLFNLVPGFPLDGGRIFRAFWWWKTGSLVHATRLAADIGKAFAITLMVIGGLEIFSGALIGGLWLIFIGMFLRGIAEGSYQGLLIRRNLGKIHVRDVMVRDPISVSPDLPLDRLIDEYFLRYGYRGYPVATNGRLHGMVTLNQMKGLSREEHRNITVGEMMRPMASALTIEPDTDVSEGLRRMSEGQSDQLFVIEDGRMIGMMTSDVLSRFLEIQRAVAR